MQDVSNYSILRHFTYLYKRFPERLGFFPATAFSQGQRKKVVAHLWSSWYLNIVL